MQTHYQTLQVLPTATEEEINLAYREQALIWHPDRNAGWDTKARMQAINEARRVLTNPALRAAYDQRHAARTNPTANEPTYRTKPHPLSDDIDVKATWRGVRIILWIISTSYLLYNGCKK